MRLTALLSQFYRRRPKLPAALDNIKSVHQRRRQQQQQNVSSVYIKFTVSRSLRCTHVLDIPPYKSQFTILRRRFRLSGIPQIYMYAMHVTRSLRCWPWQAPPRTLTAARYSLPRCQPPIIGLPPIPCQQFTLARSSWQLSLRCDASRKYFWCLHARRYATWQKQLHAVTKEIKSSPLKPEHGFARRCSPRYSNFIFEVFIEAHDLRNYFSKLFWRWFYVTFSPCNEPSALF